MEENGYNKVLGTKSIILNDLCELSRREKGLEIELEESNLLTVLFNCLVSDGAQTEQPVKQSKNSSFKQINGSTKHNNNNLELVQNQWSKSLRETESQNTTTEILNRNKKLSPQKKDFQEISRQKKSISFAEARQLSKSPNQKKQLMSLKTQKQKMQPKISISNNSSELINKSSSSSIRQQKALEECKQYLQSNILDESEENQYEKISDVQFEPMITPRQYTPQPIQFSPKQSKEQLLVAPQTKNKSVSDKKNNTISTHNSEIPLSVRKASVEAQNEGNLSTRISQIEKAMQVASTTFFPSQVINHYITKKRTK